MSPKELDALQALLDRNFAHYMGILSEDFQSKLGLVAESVLMLEEKMERRFAEVETTRKADFAFLCQQIGAVDRRLGQKIERVEERLTTVEERLTTVEERLTTVEERLTTVEERLTTVEEQLTTVKHEVKGIRQDLQPMSRCLDEHDTLLLAR